MRDLRFALRLDVIPTDALSEVEGSDPRRIRVDARSGLQRTSEVRVDSVPSPEVTILGPQVLEFEVPPGLTARALADLRVEVLGTGVSNRTDQRLTLDLGSRFQSVEGVEKLVQTVLKLLLTGLGTNRFRPGEGGGLYRMAGIDTSPAGRQRLQEDLYEAIQRTESQVVSAQAGVARLTREERLRSLRVQSADVDEFGRVDVRVRVESAAGLARVIPVIV